MALDESRLEETIGTVAGYMTGGTMCLGIWLGDELGLYKAMEGAGPMSSDDVAKRTSCHPRLVREWLDAQVAGGLVTYEADTDSYELSLESSMVLADETVPMFLARGMNAIGSMFMDIEKLTGAFRSPTGGLSWGDHDRRLFTGTEWFFRPGYRAFLSNDWIPSLDGVAAKLEAGAKVADVGCGHGASSIAMAEVWPHSQFFGFDFHEPSIEIAADRAQEAGVAGNTTFEVADAKSYKGPFDLICFFDCLHDMGDPVGIVSHAKRQLAPGGTVMLVEPFALADRAQNLKENPMAALLYIASSIICTPNSLSQDVGLGLGAQAGPAKLQQVFEEAGYSHFRVATETSLNLIIEARP